MLLMAHLWCTGRIQELGTNMNVSGGRREKEGKEERKAQGNG